MDACSFAHNAPQCEKECSMCAQGALCIGLINAESAMVVRFYVSDDWRAVPTGIRTQPVPVMSLIHSKFSMSVKIVQL